jgi:transcriptional regulator with XRE-family HTH domain
VDLRTREYSQEDRDRLGRALTARRVAVSPAWANRAEFIRATKINKKLAERIEAGQPGSYRTSTLALIAGAYRVTLESIQDALEGGELVPAGSPAATREDQDETVLARAMDAFLRCVAESDLPDDRKRLLIRKFRDHDGPRLVAEAAAELRELRRGAAG